MPKPNLKCKCLHCGHAWTTLHPRAPAVCPRCKSYNWQRKPVRKASKASKASKARKVPALKVANAVTATFGAAL